MIKYGNITITYCEINEMSVLIKVEITVYAAVLLRNR